MNTYYVVITTPEQDGKYLIASGELQFPELPRIGETISFMSGFGDGKVTDIRHEIEGTTATTEIHIRTITYRQLKDQSYTEALVEEHGFERPEEYTVWAGE